MIIKYVLLSILGLFILLNILFGSVYNEGDTISAEHQNIIFEQCYGSDVGGEIKLSDYLGKILWIDISSSWCSPCFDAIPEIDEVVYNWYSNDNVVSLVSLCDLGMPYSCEQWGDYGLLTIPNIIEGGSSFDNEDIFFNWFNTGLSYPSYVFIDHTMTVQHMINNADFSVTLANQWIEEMLGNLDVKYDEVKLPAVFSLHGNYPNPFNASTTIQYELKENSAITLSIFNIHGKEIDMIVNDYQQAGEHSITWNGQYVPSGIYFIRLSSGEIVQTRKAVLLK